jgi:WD40 repeat protein
VQTLRLLKAGARAGGHAGEVFACSFAPDGRLLLSAGWDGYLRLWETEKGEQVHEVRVAAKPLSACAVSPDGKRWLAASMDGLLSQWDSQTHHKASVYMAHTRPISTITFTSDGALLATASWDRQLILRNPATDRDARTLAGHEDIVSGCRFTPDGKTLVSWSYDGTVRLWETTRARPMAAFRSHGDRVISGAVGPDGRWAATASRDLQLKLWDLTAGQEAATFTLKAEPRACCFLLDGESLVLADAAGQLTLLAVPGLEVRAELGTRLPVQCAELSPTGNQIALGCTDGGIRLVAVDGFDSAPLVVTPTQTSQRTATLIQRLFGQSRLINALRCTCPACGQSFELPGTARGPSACPHCHRHLRLSNLVRAGGEAAGSK